MPAAFDKCVKMGGRVRTEELGKGKYRHCCYIGKKRFEGEIKTKKASSEQNPYTGALDEK